MTSESSLWPIHNRHQLNSRNCGNHLGTNYFGLMFTTHPFQLDVGYIFGYAVLQFSACHVNVWNSVKRLSCYRCLSCSANHLIQSDHVCPIIFFSIPKRSTKFQTNAQNQMNRMDVFNRKMLVDIDRLYIKLPQIIPFSQYLLLLRRDRHYPPNLLCQTNHQWSINSGHELQEKEKWRCLSKNKQRQSE